METTSILRSNPRQETAKTIQVQVKTLSEIPIKIRKKEEPQIQKPQIQDQIIEQTCATRKTSSYRRTSMPTSKIDEQQGRHQ